ncbi:hypothetical protein I8752_35295 [Nostocaceae cyanobacterium CENA369]|uniref:Uncharacterized protein n=1 Tax=Dendronalium phyllosphericum CENA369 TaxID=1725256 RepID=A0A8J7ILZ1_9NOST|nr:hypothetical protein [Dendronalium phyllosphericum]MBH8578121.1 hypothetical protein [Dendronalium phyllosphericum CENA369]
MATTLTRSWSVEFEKENLEKLFSQHAPHVPLTREHPSRPPITEAEKEHFYQYWAATGGHDLSIVQAASKAILLIPDPDLHLILSRQIGDDGAHAIAFRDRIIALTGRDPIDDIRKEAKRHWEFLEDVPYRNWLGFIAWELHYEHHILPQVWFNKLTSTIGDAVLAQQSSERFSDDEAIHRVTIANWWRKKFEQASLNERTELAAQLLELDEEIQKRRAAYIKQRWQDAENFNGSNSQGIEPIYDAWRKEVLSYLLDIPHPQLTSINQ